MPKQTQPMAICQTWTWFTDAKRVFKRYFINEIWRFVSKVLIGQRIHISAEIPLNWWRLFFTNYTIYQRHVSAQMACLQSSFCAIFILSAVKFQFHTIEVGCVLYIDIWQDRLLLLVAISQNNETLREP